MNSDIAMDAWKQIQMYNVNAHYKSLITLRFCMRASQGMAGTVQSTYIAQVNRLKMLISTSTHVRELQASNQMYLQLCGTKFTFRILGGIQVFDDGIFKDWLYLFIHVQRHAEWCRIKPYPVSSEDELFPYGFYWHYFQFVGFNLITVVILSLCFPGPGLIITPVLSAEHSPAYQRYELVKSRDHPLSSLCEVLEIVTNKLLGMKTKCKPHCEDCMSDLQRKTNIS